CARSRVTGVDRAQVAVEIARGPVRLRRVRAEARRRAALPCVVALVTRRAGDGAPRRAGSRVTGVERAQVAVEIARGPVRLRRIRAEARRRAALPCVVALVTRRAGDRPPRCAGSRVTGVERAQVAVEIARGPVRLR